MLKSRPPLPLLRAVRLPCLPALVAGEWCVHVHVAGVQGYVCVNRVGVVWRLCECKVCMWGCVSVYLLSVGGCMCSVWVLLCM